MNFINLNDKCLTSQELRDLWQPGALLHVQGTKLMSYVIRKCLNKWQKRIELLNDIEHVYDVQGSHDAICVAHKDTGEPGFGEMTPNKGGTWTPLEQYCSDIDNKKVRVWLLWPIKVSDKEVGVKASLYWWKKLSGRPYDFFAFYRLLIKSLLMDWETWPWPFSIIGKKQAGARWAWWCTESWDKCWRSQRISVMLTKNPTPLTVEHRCGAVPSVSKPNNITLRLLNER